MSLKRNKIEHGWKIDRPTLSKDEKPRGWLRESAAKASILDNMTISGSDIDILLEQLASVAQNFLDRGEVADQSCQLPQKLSWI